VAGFEDEVGNGPIYKQLKNAFKESGEALPDWFLNHADGNADEAKRAQQLKEREQQRRVRIRRREQGGNSRPEGNRRSNRSSNRSSSSNSSSDSGSNSESERRRRYERS